MKRAPEMFDENENLTLALLFAISLWRGCGDQGQRRSNCGAGVA